MGEAQGIKLFGQTIVFQVKKEESTSKNDQKVSSNQEVNITNNKKPDKIIPCPRCKSMETKFCYFNNYNVNQPRHFCKGCQRYWTAGGALRNVPVGAGRRKNKPPGRVSGCWLDDDGMNMRMNGVMMDEWQLAAAMVAGFQMKRRRNESPSQAC